MYIKLINILPGIAAPTRNMHVSAIPPESVVMRPKSAIREAESEALYAFLLPNLSATLGNISNERNTPAYIAIGN